MVRNVTEHSFSRVWTPILAERNDAPNGGSGLGYAEPFALRGYLGRPARRRAYSAMPH